MQTFFKRLIYIVENEGFKNLNDFALNGLKYDSSSKLNRLKDEKNKPSIEILLDIANKFQKVNLHWLVTGIGEKTFERQIEKQEVETNQQTVVEKKKDLVNEPTYYDESELVKNLKETIGYLKKEVEELKDDKELLKSVIKTKLGKANAS